MADVIRKSTNKFTKGLVMDFSPENTRNEVLTNALNATLLTFNGNELSLQNDMGNARVETAFLPEGYMPVGTCEYGGIIYIVSYNPLENKSQIGCFPSPERNISNKELGIEEVFVDRTFFQNFKNGNPEKDGKILHNTQYVILKNNNLNPGDKFLICANDDIYDEKLADLWVDRDKDYYEGSGYKDPNGFELIKNPIIALNVVSIEDSGKIIYLNSDVKKYEVTKGDGQYTNTYKYHILGEMYENNNTYDQTTVDPDAYRNVLSSGYSVFKSKTSGKLAILAELIMIDSYSVTHSLQPKKDTLGNIIEGSFDIIIHTDVSPLLNKENYYIAPKLKYYYLENSQGYLQVVGANVNDTKTLFNDYGIYNESFNNIPLNNIYEAIDENLKKTLNKTPYPTLGQSAKFNFPKAGTYHGRMQAEEGTTQNTSIYTKFLENKFHRINKDQVKNNADYFSNDLRAKFYFYNPSGTQYSKYTEETIDNSYLYYVKKEQYEYIDVQRNLNYKDETLYKLTTTPQLATKEEIQDITIEKYKYQEIHIYRKATNADLLNKEKLYYTNDGGFTYIELTEEPKEGEIYYVAIRKEELVPIGTVVDPNTVQGAIYYYAEDKLYLEATEFEKEQYYDTIAYPNYPPMTLYHRKTFEEFVDATEYEIANYKELGITLYYSTDYILIDRIASYSGNNQVFVVFPMDTFVAYDKFIPNKSDNYINGNTKPSGEYPKDDPIFLYNLSDYIPEIKPENEDIAGEDSIYFTYQDLKLANITLPTISVANGLDLPFKYDYTLVPCMNYGKLQHLAVSNTVDFSKLHAFNQSDFHTWKYRIDDNQLRLTFGADVYDTYETDKVDALILEFYDLWGFAGSLEITDKKSYSGIFTKIIPLNSFKALSNKRIIGNTYSTEYKRNINIQEVLDENGNPIKDSYTFAGSSISKSSKKAGWNLPDTHPETGEETNDCGTLYSNILYGVNAYFRRTNKAGVMEFIKKKEFFLYTLPIYNDYYYPTQDFSTLTYPKLQLMLTYKLKDTSTKAPYTEGEIISGYNKTDTENVASYLGGFCKKTDLNLIKYYKYTGYTDLYLEVGLIKDYEDLNISYSPAINDGFKCTLQLISDNDKEKSFEVISGIDGLTGVNQILNYNNLITEDKNKIAFKGDSNIISSYIKGCNFITSEGTDPIKINYEFVVGYTINIADIRSTQVPATTVCALFHMKPTGEYNYEDFGIYEQEAGVNEDGTPKYELLSSAMFYNEGTYDTEIFGVCRQISTDTSKSMLDQLSIIAPIETEAQKITRPGKLNSGEPLKQLVKHIGKLTFCQPHAHGFSEVNGVNIHEGKNGNTYGIPPEITDRYIDSDLFADTEYDQCYGINPRTFLQRRPKYNLSLNTKNSMLYYSEFLSTLDYKTITSEVRLDALEEGNRTWRAYTMREYTGFTGKEIATFNEKLIKTMSSIYAYNPDYDSLTINAGNVQLQNYNPKFTSNILNIDSQLSFKDNKTLNDFIYLGTIKFSNYLNYLTENSKIEDSSIGFKTHLEEKNEETQDITTIPLPQVQLIPNYDYCGTSTNKYLISSLTYNTPTPKEIEQELEFTSSNITVVKHSNGKNIFMQGTPNKKLLYAFSSDYNKMIQLDVSNYNIKSDGTLEINKDGAKQSKQEVFEITQEISSEVNEKLLQGTYSFTYPFKNLKEETVDINLSISLDTYGVVPVKVGTDSFFMGIEYSNNVEGCSFSFQPHLYITSSTDNPNYSYSVKIDSIEMQVNAVPLNDKVSLYGYPIALGDQSIETLQKFTSQQYGNINLVDYNKQPVSGYTNEYWVGNDPYCTLYANNSSCQEFLNTIPLNKAGEIVFKFQPNINPYSSTYVLGLFEFKITKINFTINQISNLELLPETFVHTTITKKYSDIIGNKYTVLEEYKKTRIRGSSITINDLTYDPSPDGHRLFIKNDLCSYNSTFRGKLYYRFLNGGDDSGHPSWDYNDTKYLNNLFLYTGPCYTSDNLIYNQEIDG